MTIIDQMTCNSLSYLLFKFNLINSVTDSAAAINNYCSSMKSNNNKINSIKFAWQMTIIDQMTGNSLSYQLFKLN